MIKFAQTMEMLSWFLVDLFASMFLAYLAQFYGWTTKVQNTPDLVLRAIAP